MSATEPEAHPVLSGVVLAAGASTRMGRPKPLLPLGGRPVLQHVLDAAAASRLDELVLVLGDRAEEIRQVLQLPTARPLRVVVNPDPALGQSASLREGLRAADPRAVAAGILLGDQPAITAELIDGVAAAFLAGAAPAARPVYRGPGAQGVPGHPVFLARRIWPAVEQLRGDEGARALFSTHPDWLLEVAVEGEPPADLDTTEDYRRAVGAARRAGTSR